MDNTSINKTSGGFAQSDAEHAQPNCERRRATGEKAVTEVGHSTKFPQTSTAPAVATAPNRSERGSSCFPSCPCNASDACEKPVKDLRILLGPDHSDFYANACFTKYCIEHHGPIDLERLCCRLMDVKLGVVEAPSCFPAFPKATTFVTRTLWHPSRVEAPKVARLQRWGRA